MSLITFPYLFFFIGSTTDLTPSVIGYYDRLSGSFNGDKLIGEVTQEKPLEALRNFTKEQSPKPKLIVSKIPTKPTAIATSISTNNKSLPKINSNLFSHQQHHPSAKTLQIISPNVHRMISSHQTTTETITNSYVLSNSNNLSSHLSRSGSHNLQVNKRQGGDKSAVNLPLSTQRRLFGNKPTGIAIPLTKNLSKISQSNGLVDSIEPIVHTITDNNCNNEEILNKSGEVVVDSERTPTNCDHNFNYDNLNYHDDDDDNIQNVLDKTSELINNLLSGGGNDKNINNSALDIHENTNNSNNNDRVQPSIDEMSRHKYKLHVNSAGTDEEEAAQKAKNAVVEKLATSLKTYAKSLDNVTEIDTKQQPQQQNALPPTASPKLTYSRAKLLSNQNADATVTSASDGKLNASPSTKHRPLSAASISSSSSSTSTASSSNSFGNEILTGANRQYLASIESLADHSENEVNHPSLTMCERAALEIVESEKSYVQDLGQIIKG